MGAWRRQGSSVSELGLALPGSAPSPGQVLTEVCASCLLDLPPSLSSAHHCIQTTGAMPVGGLQSRQWGHRTHD